MSGDRFVSYAQNQEDVVLARALHPDDRGGFWVDVGAGDPVLDSVTAAFAESRPPPRKRSRTSRCSRWRRWAPTSGSSARPIR